VSRLYSGFPARAPGTGLLLLRMAIGATLVAQAMPCLSGAPDPRLTYCLLALVSGASLIVGFLTRIVAAIAATLVASTALLSLTSSSVGSLQSHPLDLNMIVVAVAIALLGPGAISLDAALFGRRKVIIPRSSVSSRP
jgi:uncharacterized membrane protein YphA (DoxX/SURF4 family)